MFSLTRASLLASVLSFTLLVTSAHSAEGVRKSITIDGHNVSYMEWGSADKPMLLMISGAGGTASGWLMVAPALSESYHIISIEPLGQGYSDWDPKQAYSVRTHVDTYKAVVTKLGYKNYFVLGHSQGGNEAVVYAAENANAVTALIIEDGGLLPEGSTHAQMATTGVRPTPKTEFASWDEAKATLTGNLTPDQRQLEADNRFKQLPNGRVVSRNDPDFRRISEADVMMQPYATAPYAKQIKAPTMVIRGNNDRSFTKPAFEELVSLIPDTRLTVTVMGAGHSLHRDKPTEFTAGVRAFLSLFPTAK